MRKKITVVIGTYNVERIIGRCLDALRWADEVNIVDTCSTDRTRELCARYPNVRFYEREEWLNPNINYGIERASHEWILRLDSDEVVTPELAAEIQEEVLTEKSPQYSGFHVPSRVHFFGKWIKYGPAFQRGSRVPGEAYRKMLFRKGTASYRCESQHEDMTTLGEYGFLKNIYLHYSHDSISQWIGKMNLYTDVDARLVPLEQISFKPFFRLRLLYWLVQNFYGLYVRNHGHRDGFHGFVVCLLHAWYPIIQQLKLWEKKWKAEHQPETR